MANKIEYLDEKGLARLAEDLEVRHPSTFTGTRAEWDALPQARKDLYKIVNFTDDDDTFLGIRHPNIFTGTRAEWMALSHDEKVKYLLVCLTDDLSGIGWYLSNEVVLGDMNPVTSNAVALKLTDIQIFDLDKDDWVANTDPDTSTDYPYIYEIATDLYSDDAVPLWDLLGATSELPTESERDAINTILETDFSSTGIILYANEQPTIDLRLRVKGR